MSATVKVYGASDDLIEIEGALVAEFYAICDFADSDDGLDGGLLVFSDGTVLEVVYGERGRGFWRIRRLVKGAAGYKLEEASDEDRDYSDKATLTGDFRWVVFGKSLVKAEPA